MMLGLISSIVNMSYGSAFTYNNKSSNNKQQYQQQQIKTTATKAIIMRITVVNINNNPNIISQLSQECIE